LSETIWHSIAVVDWSLSWVRFPNWILFSFHQFQLLSMSLEAQHIGFCIDRVWMVSILCISRECHPYLSPHFLARLRARALRFVIET
jgi:hypothetical protein